jgi:hypothetical protein
LDENFATGGFRLRLHGWSVERRFVVRREWVREDRDSLGRKLIAVPGYTFRVFVTEAAFHAVFLLFNLLAEFQPAAGLPGYREPAAGWWSTCRRVGAA